MKENEKMGRIGERTKKQQGARRQEMVVDVSFKFLKTVVIKEARNQKGAPRVGRYRKRNC